MSSWRKVGKIATGGQARVYRVENSDTGETAVMKELLRTQQHEDPDAELRRFAREVRAQTALEHEHIMPILASNFSESPPYYIMPHADRSLKSVIESHPKGVPAIEAVAIFSAIAPAVDYAHLQGIIHRDLKPANILEVDGEWVVADFGLCRDLDGDSTTFTRTSTPIGTIAYMAPEQFHSPHTVGERADTFALGRILYHLLTGQAPFPALRLSLLPQEFKFPISKATAVDEEARYLSVAEFAREIALVSAQRDSLTPPTERGRDLLSAVLDDGSSAAVDELVRLLLDNVADEAFFTQFVSRLPRVALAHIQRHDMAAFEEVVTTFDKYCVGSHPFNFVDVIVDFFISVFMVASDPLLRATAIERVLSVGESHHRYYAGDALAKLVESTKKPADAMILVSAMRAQERTLYFYKTYLQSVSLSPEIRKLFAE